jgi:hypothetical protein
MSKFSMQADCFCDKILSNMYLVKKCIDQIYEYSIRTKRSPH